MFSWGLAHIQVQQWATYVQDTGTHCAMELLLQPVTSKQLHIPHAALSTALVGISLEGAQGQAELTPDKLDPCFKPWEAFV